MEVENKFKGVGKFYGKQWKQQNNQKNQETIDESLNTFELQSQEDIKNQNAHLSQGDLFSQQQSLTKEQILLSLIQKSDDVDYKKQKELFQQQPQIPVIIPKKKKKKKKNKQAKLARSYDKNKTMFPSYEDQVRLIGIFLETTVVKKGPIEKDFYLWYNQTKKQVQLFKSHSDQTHNEDGERNQLLNKVEEQLQQKIFLDDNLVEELFFYQFECKHCEIFKTTLKVLISKIFNLGIIYQERIRENKEELQVRRQLYQQEQKEIMEFLEEQKKIKEQEELIQQQQQLSKQQQLLQQKQTQKVYQEQSSSQVCQQQTQLESEIIYKVNNPNQQISNNVQCIIENENIQIENNEQNNQQNNEEDQNQDNVEKQGSDQEEQYQESLIIQGPYVTSITQETQTDEIDEQQIIKKLNQQQRYINKLKEELEQQKILKQEQEQIQFEEQKQEKEVVKTCNLKTKPTFINMQNQNISKENLKVIIALLNTCFEWVFENQEQVKFFQKSIACLYNYHILDQERLRQGKSIPGYYALLNYLGFTINTDVYLNEKLVFGQRFKTQQLQQIIDQYVQKFNRRAQGYK